LTLSERACRSLLSREDAVSTTARESTGRPRFQPKAHRNWQRLSEPLIEFSLLCCGLLSIAVTLAIAAVVLYGSAEFFLFKDAPANQVAAGGHRLEPMTAGEVWDRFVYFFTGREWTAGFNDARYGVLPLLAGSFLVTAIAALIALPIGVTTAIYLSEYAKPRVRAIAKPTLELLAGIPTVVYGFFAVTAVTPFLVSYVDPEIGNPHNQLAGGIVVGIMIIPMVASLSEDALRAVPRSLRDGAIALGANRFDTSLKVVLPAGLSGVTASFLLAISRAIGETMAVSLACGDTARWTLDPREGLATMTSFIVRAAKGDVESGTTYFNSLFAVAGLLFFLTLGMNIAAQLFIRRYRQVYQ
jgi:phosphate transport system permease protein